MNTIKILKSHLKLILNKSDIIELAAAVYLGTVMGQFLQSIVHGILMPLMHNFIPIEILQQKFQLLNMDFKPVMSNLVSTIIALFLVYLICCRGYIVLIISKMDINLTPQHTSPNTKRRALELEKLLLNTNDCAGKLGYSNRKCNKNLYCTSVTIENIPDIENEKCEDDDMYIS